MSKLWPSTRFWAFSIALLRKLCSMTSPSCIPMRSIRPEMRSDPKIRIRSSSRREEELGGAGVTLAASAAAQLVVDAA